MPGLSIADGREDWSVHDALGEGLFDSFRQNILSLSCGLRTEENARRTLHSLGLPKHNLQIISKKRKRRRQRTCSQRSHHFVQVSATFLLGPRVCVYVLVVFLRCIWCIDTFPSFCLRTAGTKHFTLVRLLPEGEIDVREYGLIKRGTPFTWASSMHWPISDGQEERRRSRSYGSYQDLPAVHLQKIFLETFIGEAITCLCWTTACVWFVEPVNLSSVVIWGVVYIAGSTCAIFTAKVVISRNTVSFFIVKDKRKMAEKTTPSTADVCVWWVMSIPQALPWICCRDIIVTYSENLCLYGGVLNFINAKKTEKKTRVSCSIYKMFKKEI